MLPNKGRYLALCLAVLLSLSVSSVFAQTLIENSYIISFKEDAGLIDPPNPENRGKVPFGEPTSGQDKTALAATLGLNGEIFAIFAGINAIAVHMDAAEAERWAQDPRVQYVEQDMYITAANTDESKSDYPVYRGDMDTLLIPRVDTHEQADLFQDGVLQYDPAIDAWRLIEFQTVPISAIPVYWLEGSGVEVAVTDTFPVQVFLKIKGHLSCAQLGRISQRMKDNNFDIVVGVSSQSYGPQACFTAFLPFEKIVPLEVYGLPAGTYSYTVNGTHSGVFELKVDNQL